ncbi:glutamate synthase subunit beta [Oceanobacillus bengalensis]|uniref:Glutamate synthase subunit beta n=1 Tax=Oceanobacillus bengalensis TaxID=1435466 RepID=A0A494YRY3_9BACI|nr:glutamate synthase subunit beta [Oceanobacillus bengalensis]RKQ12420.1 glutamate synthase subunit beta [Oceanobacillus bengalensis]
MGNITGFMEHQKVPLHYRDPMERIKDWNEIATLPTEEILREQASRCMDCAVPFCQDGTQLAGMTTGCPVYNLIPEWNDLVYKGRWKEAYHRLSRTNPFPEFTGRACPAPCEGGCVATLATDSVTIKNIERAIIDKAFEEGWVQPNIPKHRTGKKVAVIGSGPAGLACASVLNQHGHQVTVYERADRIGGLLTYGIPKTKIEQYVVDRRIRLMEEEGIAFVTNTEVGKQLQMDQLHSENDAVILCIGSTRPRDLNIPGRNQKGIHFAMDYLHQNTKSLLDSNFADEEFINAEGKDVIVIGGGDTATDCVTTAVRQNCKSLVQFDIYPIRPTKRAEDNPWPQYPVIHKVDTGQEEAKHVFGNDPRAFATTAQGFTSDKYGNITGVKSVNIKTKFNEKGEKIRDIVPGTEKIWSAQLVLLAIGFSGPETGLIKQTKVALNNQSNIKVKKDTFQTDEEGIFAAGDARTGASLIVWAIQEGKEAAMECHHYLMRNVS